MPCFGLAVLQKKNKETTCEDFLLEELGASMGQAPAQFYSAGVIIVRQFPSVIWNLWRCTDRSVTRFPSSPRRRCRWASSAFELWGPRCRGASYWGPWCWRACPVAHDAPTWSSWRCRRRWRTCTPPCCACPTLLSSWWYELLWQVLWRWRRWWWWLLPSSLFKGDRGIEFPRLDGEHIDLGIIIVNSKAEKICLPSISNMKAKRDETLRVSCCDSTYTGLCNQTWMTLVIRTIIVIIIISSSNSNSSTLFTFVLMIFSV